MPNTKVVGIIFPYILTPIPNLYDHSFPRYGQITFLTFRRPTTLTFDSHGVPIRNMYAKFHNDRLRNGWDIALWNFAKTRTNKQTNTHTNKHTNKQTNRHGHYNTSPSPYGGEVIRSMWVFLLHHYQVVNPLKSTQLPNYLRLHVVFTVTITPKAVWCTLFHPVQCRCTRLRCPRLHCPPAC